MGANYYKIIRSLIQFKDELKHIDEKKYTAMINIIQEYKVPDDKEENEYVPTNTELAEKLKIPQQKVNLLLKGLYGQILEYFSGNSLMINECEQIINIHIPYDEQDRAFLKKDPKFYSKFSQWLVVKLPVIPRIGEEISLDFIDGEFGADSGYVYNIRHKITGKKQQIMIEVHPTDNYYFRWKKLEADYERKQRWLKEFNDRRNS